MFATDFGDAPASYGTLLTADGARHTTGTLRLGSLIDDEADGLPHAFAQGDDANNADDEDGVFFGNLILGQATTYTINLAGGFAGKIDAWVDFNRNGVFDDPLERVTPATGASVNVGANTLTVTAPGMTVPGLTYARFRLSTAGALAPTGAADDGEVEDYALYLYATTKIALDSSARSPGRVEIHVMDANGLNPARLTFFSQDVRHAAWSPDGSKIAFASPDPSQFQIWVINNDGSGLTRITNAGGFSPSWSPDGSKIAFTGVIGSTTEIFVMNPDGSGVTQITNNTNTGNGEPTWAPDARRIAFTSYRDGNAEIYVMDADGSNQTRLTNNTKIDDQAAWSPDGSQIAFSSDRDGDFNIYVMNVDGSAQTRLTSSLASEKDPSWSPDAAKIAFTNDLNVSVINRDGSGRVLLTDPVFFNYDPAWGGIVTPRDMGDAPDSYGTTLATNGARHLIGGPRLGTLIDEENNGQPHAFAQGDDGNNTDDEDGVFVNNLILGSASTFTINVTSQAGKLDAWVDFNRDGVFHATDERITAAGGTSIGIGTTTLSVTPPAGAVAGLTFARLRISTAGGLTPTGLALDGEVEDHPLYIYAAQKIAFVSFRNGNEEIYLMNADGSGVTRLTSNAAFDGLPAWSPDGSKIVFRSDRDGNNEIYAMNADGTGVIRLTNNAELDFEPAWSPDGSKIAFRSHRDGNGEIYVMNADGSGVTRLTNNAEFDNDPAWSPDGSKIAFGSARDGNSEIYVMNADGTGQTRLTNDAATDIFPVWSPGGSKIAFTSRRDGNYEIYVMNANGTGQTRLTTNAADDTLPTWSPDGSKIAFRSERDGNGEIYVMNADGTNQTNLTMNGFYDAEAAWGGIVTLLDFGDAPNTYGTTLASNGARHLFGGPRFGTLSDAEPDGQPSANADGDDVLNTDDEDGITFGMLGNGLQGQVTVTVSGAAGKLDAWIDFDRNGTFDPGERITAAGGQSVSVGSNVVTFSVPVSAFVGRTISRFRLSTAGGLNPTGPAADGEVEDHAVTIQQPYLRTNAEVILDAANKYVLSANNSDFGQPMVPLYMDSNAGGIYGVVNDAVRITTDANDPDAARGASSFSFTWNGTGTDSYFQFGTGTTVANRPRDIADFGFAHAVRFLAKGDIAGRQIQVNVFRTQTQQVASQFFTLSSSFEDYELRLPADLRPQDIHAVQFFRDSAHGLDGKVWLDEVRLATDGFDRLRLIQSFPAPQWGATGSATSTPQGRDASIYPALSSLYDAALTIKGLIVSADVAAHQVARDLGDAILATAANGANGYLNARPSGHVLLGDGSVRQALSQQKTLGDNSWFGLALLDLYQLTNDVTYLTRAREISDWAEINLRGTDAFKGYRGGFDAAGVAFPWRSTEHNADFFELNRQLAELLTKLGDVAAPLYAARATHAGDFVISMFDGSQGQGKFWTGTTGQVPDTINMTSVPLDAQLWTFLTLGQSTQYGASIDWTRPIQWAEANLVRTDGAITGFTFSSGSTANKVWLEGVAHGAVVADVMGDWAKRDLALLNLERASSSGHGVLAVSSDSLTDPAFFGAGEALDARAALAATVWATMGRAGRNPFSLSPVFSDIFNRADDPALGQNWSEVLTDAAIQANRALVPGTLSLALHNRVFAADVGVQADVTVAGTGVSQAGLVARYGGTGDTNMYLGVLLGMGGAFSARIYKNVGGTWTLLSSGAVGSGSGLLRFEALGNSLKLFFNGALATSVVDNSFAGPGLVGIRGLSGTFDNFSTSLPTSALAFSDSFTRADNTSLGPDFTETAGDLSIQGNQLAAPGTISVAVYNGLFAADVSVRADVTVPATGTAQAGLVARYTGPGDTNMYLGTLLGLNGNFSARIYKNVGGTWTLLSMGALGSGTGSLRFEVLGNSLKLFFNGSLVTSVIDNSLRDTGLAGVRGSSASFDAFSAGALLSALALSDSFTRADSTNLGAGFTETAGDLAIQGNQIAAPGSISLAVANRLFAGDVRLQADVFLPSTGTPQAGLVARYSGAGDSNMYVGLLLGINGNFSARIYKNVGGTWTLLSLAAVGSGTGTLRFEVLGNSLKLFFNGVLTTSVIDNSLQGPGLAGLRGSSGTFDNFQLVETLSPLAFNDAVNRADSTNLGANFTEVTGDFSIQATRLVAPAPISLAVYNGAIDADVNLQADVAVASSGSSQAGLVARYSGPGDTSMYVGMLHGLNGNFSARVYKNVGGTWSLLSLSALAAGSGTLRFEVLGNSLKLFFNGILATSVVDNSLQAAGLAGVRGSLATFDDTSAVRRLSTISFSDSFTRADSTNLGPGFTEVTGDLSIQGNRIAAPAAMSLAVENELFAADISLQAAVVVAGTGVSQAGLVARYTGPGDSNMYVGILLGQSGSFSARIYKNVAGTWTLLSSSALGTGTGTLRFEVLGNSLKLFFNGTLATSTIDNALQLPGLAGLRGQSAFFDDCLFTDLVE